MVSIVFSCDNVLFFLSSVPPLLSLPLTGSKGLNKGVSNKLVVQLTRDSISLFFLQTHFCIYFTCICQTISHFVTEIIVKASSSWFLSLFFCTMLATPPTANYKSHIYIFLLIYNVSFQIHFEHFEQHILSFALSDI